jgi:hypothetical protein
MTFVNVEEGADPVTRAVKIVQALTNKEERKSNQ